MKIEGYDPRTKQQELETFLVEKCTASLQPEGPSFTQNGYSLRVNLVISFLCVITVSPPV